MIAEAFAGVLATFAGTVFDPLDPKDPAIRRLLGGGGRTEAGIEVSEESAMKCAPFWRGVNLICNTMSKVPLRTIRNLGEDGKEVDREHRAHRLLRWKPNAEQTAGVFRRALMGHALTYGNGYAYIFRDSAAMPLEMAILLPDRTKPVRNASGQLLYRTRIAGETRHLLPENVLHIRGLSWDGIAGYSAVENGAESLGVGMAARQFGARFFGQGANASGLLLAPTGLNEDEEKRFKKSFEEAHQGLSKSHGVILLEEGAKFQQLTIPPENAQFLESREFDLLEVANWLGLPPHKLGHPGRTSYNSLEQSNQEYLDDSIEPWFCVWEEECRDKLLTEEEKRGETHSVEFQREALRRVDLKSETESLIMELNNGALTLDEYRRVRNRPALPDGLGRKHRRPANILNEGEEQIVQPPPASTAPSPGKEPPPIQQRGEAVQVVVRECVSRCCARLANQCRAAGKDGASFVKWADAITADPAERETLSQVLCPAAAVLVADHGVQAGSHQAMAQRLADVVSGEVGRRASAVADKASEATIRAAAEALANDIRGPVADQLTTLLMEQIA